MADVQIVKLRRMCSRTLHLGMWPGLIRHLFAANWSRLVLPIRSEDELSQLLCELYPRSTIMTCVLVVTSPVQKSTSVFESEDMASRTERCLS